MYVIPSPAATWSFKEPSVFPTYYLESWGRSSMSPFNHYSILSALVQTENVPLICPHEKKKMLDHMHMYINRGEEKNVGSQAFVYKLGRRKKCWITCICDPVQQKGHDVGLVHSEIMNKIVCKI